MVEEMSFKYQENQRYRMPVIFGPSISPRQGPDGKRYDYSETPKTGVSLQYLTEARRLEALLPPGFRLYGDPVVTVEFSYYPSFEWLAGRGYNTLGIKFPVEFRGETDRATGPFLAVLWENMPEPIITGREELGFAKLYCEIPGPRVIGDTHYYTARWDGHVFLKMTLSGLAEAEAPTPTINYDGVLHYQYVPKVGRPGESLVEQAVLTPAGGMTLRTDRYRIASGSNIEFVRSTWEQLPTMHTLINTMAELPIVEVLGASIANQRGAKDLSDQRPLR